MTYQVSKFVISPARDIHTCSARLAYWFRVDRHKLRRVCMDISDEHCIPIVDAHSVSHVIRVGKGHKYDCRDEILINVT